MKQAYGGVVIDLAGQVLLREPAKRSRRPAGWTFAKGKPAPGETPEETALREVLEETGLTIDVGPMVEVLDRISRDGDGRVEHHFVLVDFVCRPSGGVLRGASDAEDAAWVALADLPQYGVAAVTVGVIQKEVTRGFDTGDRPLVW